MLAASMPFFKTKDYE